jgi:PAS domain S-box-containing protein
MQKNGNNSWNLHEHDAFCSVDQTVAKEIWPMSSLQALSSSLALSGYTTLLTLDQVILDALPAALYLASANGHIMRANQRAQDLLGESELPVPLEQASVLRIFNTDGSALPFETSPMARALREGDSCQDLEFLIQGSDGARRSMLVGVEPLKDRQGVLEGSVNCFQDITSLRRDEASVREGEHRFRELLDALPAAIYTTDADGFITFCNKAATELSGRELQLGEDKWCVSWRLHRTDGTFLPHDQCPMAVALKERRPIRDIELIAERPDGTRIPVMPYPTPLHNAAGEFTGAVNMLVETTEMRRVQATMSQRAREQAALFGFTDTLYRAETAEAIHEAGLDAIMGGLHCSRAAILLFDEANVMRFAASRGLSDDYRKSVEGHTPWQAGERNAQPIFIGDAEAAGSLGEVKNSVLAEGIGALSFIPVAVKGQVIGKFMAYYDTPHSFDDNEIKLAVTIARQLGFSLERMRAEDELRHNEERLRAMFEHAGVGMTELDPNGAIIRANAAFLAIIGRPMDEVYGRGSIEFTHPDDIPIHEQAVAELRNGEGPVPLEKRYVRKDGRDVWARLTLSRGNEDHLLAIVENIDARKRAEQIVRESADQLTLVTDTVPVLIAHCDANCRYKFVNKLYAELFGRTLDECIGKTVSEIMGAETHEAAREWIDLVLSGKAVDFEMAVSFPKTGKRFMQCYYVPEFDKAGAVKGWMAAITDITERKLHEEAVTESEERFRAIVDTTPECVKLVAPDGTLLHMNASGLGMVGADELSSVIGKSIYTVISPKDRDAFREFNELICRGEKGALEFEIVSLDGVSRHMETHAAPFRTAAGDTVQLAVTRDVTARKRAEEKLVESQAHLRLTTEAAQIGTWQWNIQRGELHWSALHKEFWGYEPAADHISYDDWARCVHPDDLTLVEKSIEDCLAGNAPYDVEYRMTPRGQTEQRWIRSTGRATFDDSGKPTCLQGVSLDVTDRKRAEDRLRKSEAEFRTLADNINHLAWMTDASGWIYWYNKRWFDYTGTTLTEVEGWGWRKLHHPDHVDRVVAKVSRCFETGEPWEDTFPILGKDGEYRWFLSRAVPIRNEQGRIVRWFGTNTDITERRQAEEQRTLLINELNHRVKNTLATVQAIAAQTLRGAEADPSLRERLEARLLALSNAHNILTEESWEGAEIRQIVTRALEPHADPERLRIEGPALRISPKAAVAIAMGIHELATNAVKYGAFSNETGCVELNWRITAGEQPELELYWRESGGPTVVEPVRRGFGSRLIERNLAHDLDGSARIDYAPDGVVCHISCPLTAIIA